MLIHSQDVLQKQFMMHYRKNCDNADTDSEEEI